MNKLNIFTERQVNHLLVLETEISLEEEEEAKLWQRTRDETSIYDPRYLAKTNWIGLLSEWGCLYWLGINNLVIQQDPFSPCDYDAFLNNESIDSKARGGKDIWRDYYSHAVDENQLKEKNYHKLLLCHYALNHKVLGILGWVYGKEYIEYGVSYKKGIPVREFNNTPTKNDCLVLAAKYIRNLSTFETAP